MAYDYNSFSMRLRGVDWTLAASIIGSLFIFAILACIGA